MRTNKTEIVPLFRMAEMTKKSHWRVVLRASLIGAAAIGLFHAANVSAAKATNPDFTKGEFIPKGFTHDWNLGATGARGWMFSDTLVTTDARQIKMTKVAQGSPADGVLAVGDVVLRLRHHVPCRIQHRHG